MNNEVRHRLSFSSLAKTTVINNSFLLWWHVMKTGGRKIEKNVKYVKGIQCPRRCNTRFTDFQYLKVPILKSR